MKKLISIIALSTLSLSATAFAADEYKPLRSLEQAQYYCPPTNQLTFSSNSTDPDRPGTITGNNRVAFVNIPNKPAPRPKDLDASGFIQNINFLNEDRLYGYIDNGKIVCFYSYVNYANLPYWLVMQSK